MRIAAYCRVSTNKDEQLESLENQKLFFEEFAKKNNYELVKIYADEGISGKQSYNRKEFLKMLDDADLKIFDMVVVKDISRWARNTVVFLNSIRSLKAKNIDVKFLSNNQTILGDSEFILTIFSAMAQEESANLSKRIKFGKKVTAQKGRVPSRVYGYKRIDNYTLEPDENEAPIVKQIFDMYVNQGYGINGISKKLYENEIPSKLKLSHNSWCPGTVRRIIMNPIYTGKYTNNKLEIKDYLTGERVRLPESQYIHHERPEFRIISDELFNAAQEKLNRNREIYKNEYTHIQGRESNKYIFSTLIRCSYCGLAFARKTYTYIKTRTYWICPGFNNRGSKFCNNRTTIEEEEMIKIIRDYFINLISNQSKFIENIISEFTKKFNETQSKIDFNKINKQINKLENEKDKYKTMYINGIIDIDELKKFILISDEKINEFKSKIINFDKMQNKINNIESLSKELYSDVKSILEMDSWNNIELKKIINNIIVNEEGNVDIFLKKIY